MGAQGLGVPGDPRRLLGYDRSLGSFLTQWPIIVIVVVVASLLVYAATRPNSFRIQRSATMRATPERIFFAVRRVRLRALRLGGQVRAERAALR